MAKTYTYDDFVNAANNAGMLGAFSQEDLTISQNNPEYGLSLLKLQQDASKATTSEQKLLAQEAVNQLRKTYSTVPAASAAVPASSAVEITSSDDGTASSAAPDSGTGYTYSGENAYQNALQGVTDYGSYDYDYKQDPTYAGMKDTYLQDNQTMVDRALSNPAVSTSAPSYGSAAAGQSANYYAGKLNDIIPQLEQDAYERYLKDFELRNSQLDAAAADKAYDFEQWQKQQELELAAQQQKYANDLLLYRNFGQPAPSLPDLSGVGTGTSAVLPDASESDTTAAGTDPLAPIYSYGQQTDYQAALDAVLNNPEFTYVIANDPQYASLRKSYLREGLRANEDALARASAASLGIPSSYAIRQAADAGNSRNEQLMGVIPGLQENAYGRYLADFQNTLNVLSQLSEDRDLDYAQWLQDYQLQEKVKQQNFDNAVALYKATGQMTPKIAAALGIKYVPPVVYSYYEEPSYGPGGPTVYSDHNAMVAGIIKDYGQPGGGYATDYNRLAAMETAASWYQQHGKYR